MKLPTNKKFGYFFCSTFFILGGYFFYNNYLNTAYIFLFLTLSFFLITFLKADLLLPLNKIWMKFGYFIGGIVSPIILGIIFFGLFTPYSIIMKIMKRDALRLKKKTSKSYWIIRSQSKKQTDFKQQF